MLALAAIVDGMSLAERVRFHQERIQRDLGHETRGDSRPVVRDDWTEYPSVSAAARAQPGHVKPDWICQAIRRDGTCAGHRWAYIEDIPADFFANRVGASCPWPYSRGNPVIYPKGTAFICPTFSRNATSANS